MADVQANVESPAIAGKAFGGQQPVVGATISVVAMGTSGYGSNGIVLASTQTNSSGDFTFAPNAYTCPQTNTPVYLLGIGGNSGFGNNGSSVEAAALGTCTNAKASFVVMNEVTTVATAFALSHFFSTAFGGFNGENDWFGGPSSGSLGSLAYSKGLVNGNNVTIPSIVNNSAGTVQPNSGTITIEAQKINTIANILAACINSSGSLKGGEPCQQLFKFTTTPSGAVPSDTLQAAVSMALNPANTAAKMTDLYNLITAQAPFSPFLTGAPNDWTIGVSYTSSAAGLAVDTGTTSTLDIDSTGNIWFPSNAATAAGAAYFSPASQTFFGPFNTTVLIHPQQVAIDANGFAWYNDSANSAVSGYLVSAPGTTESVSLPGTLSNAVSVGSDDRVSVGVTLGAISELAAISPNRSNYSTLAGVSFPFPVTSVAADTSGGEAVGVTNAVTTRMDDYYVTSAPAALDVVNANNADSGQVLFTGNDHVGVRSYPGSGKQDGLCIYSIALCYSFAGSSNNTSMDQGIAIDGGGQLWVAESASGGVLQIPINNPGATGAAVYVNSSGGANIPNNQFLHNGSDGETATATAPYGIAVDATGNVWMSNAGCTTIGCTPGAFTLTEIVGAAYPTINPVSAQITGGTSLVGTEPTN
jgi:hypothetical protein